MHETGPRPGSWWPGIPAGGQPELDAGEDDVQAFSAHGERGEPRSSGGAHRFNPIHACLAKRRAVTFAELSPYLSSGKRSGEGNGPAFVGRLGDAWSELDSGKQRIEARVLVKALRARGIREIMLYDDDGRLRIQALGSQPLRIDPVPSAR